MLDFRTAPVPKGSRSSISPECELFPSPHSTCPAQKLHLAIKSADTDGEGNVRQLTRAGGAVTDRYEYDLVGNEFTVSGEGSTPNNYLYRGGQYEF